MTITTEVQRKVTSADMVAALAAKYCQPQFAFFSQVRNAAGFDASNTADAMAIGLWPSRGLELHGFEIKVSRGDWLKEISQPAKAESICCYCDRWWMAVSGDDIVRLGELPPTWGLLILSKSLQSFRVVIEAPKLSPDTMPRSFIAALLKRAYDSLKGVGEDEIKTAVRRALEKERTDQKTTRDASVPLELTELRALKKSVDAF